MKVPLLLIPLRAGLKISRPLYGVSTRILEKSKFLSRDLAKLESDLSPAEYLNLAIVNSIIYFFIAAFLAWSILRRAGHEKQLEFALATGLIASLGVLFFCLAYPRWLSHKKTAQIDRDLLFAARHLRIQTTAGVPLFESLVSASSGYGIVSDEFKKIVTTVQAGGNLAIALEETAMHNPSYYYSRILWQMSNAVKAGTDIGPVLSEIVDFLAEEQRIEMRNYGAQLNTLAIMYLMACIIVPTISLIFLMVISSFIDLPITDTVLLFILASMVFVQYMFIGLIESRRPAVAI